MDKFLVTVAGFLAIIGTGIFFFWKKEEVILVRDRIDIEVNGGYKPSSISVQKGKKTTLSFFRTDPNSCLEEVIISDFKIKKTLPLNEKVDVEITPKEAGEYDISCAMGMFHGKIIVK